VLRLAGYTLSEKINIAQRFLVLKQLKEHGLSTETIKVADLTVRDIIEKYTREAGVRNLEREIASVCRKLARRVVREGPAISLTIEPEALSDYLGVPKFRPKEKEQKDEVGVAVGLAWTEGGGEILTIEATRMTGKGKLTLTGKLGEVMKESAHAALSYVRSRAAELGIEEGFHRKYDIHVHIPEGAIPKDGPSAGIALATAMASMLSEIPVRGDVAMTGEITLRGNVLPIGGVKEKVRAAFRYGFKTIVLPKENEKDLAEIPDDIAKQLQFRLVETMDEVLDTALVETSPPVDLSDADSPGRLEDAASDGSVTH